MEDLMSKSNPRNSKRPRRRKFFGRRGCGDAGAATLGFPTDRQAAGPDLNALAVDLAVEDIFHEYALDYGQEGKPT